MKPPPWLSIRRGEEPLVVSIPHAGTDIPAEIEARLVSPRRARQDADWWIDRLYSFAAGMGATVIRTAISRTVVDVNRDPSGVSLYPGQATTELVPTTTFDGEPLWLAGKAPDGAEIAARRATYFDPYHAALSSEIARLTAAHGRVVLYDCHSIRSVIPRLFPGELPVFNIGTNGGLSCDDSLERTVATLCSASGKSVVVNGRFKGGFITRRHGRPADGVHAVQMELACRGYMREPIADFDPDAWPTPWDEARAAPIRETLRHVLEACVAFGRA
jgi:formiminoglutamase